RAHCDAARKRKLPVASLRSCRIVGYHTAQDGGRARTTQQILAFLATVPASPKGARDGWERGARELDAGGKGKLPIVWRRAIHSLRSVASFWNGCQASTKGALRP